MAEATLIERALVALRRVRMADDFDGLVTPHQLAVLEDDSRLIVIRTPRRSGKSQVLCAKLFDRGLRTPGKMSLAFALIRDQARKIFYDEMISWAERLEIPLTPRYADLEIHLPNGHRILIRGAESDADMEKWRGLKFVTVACDEAASFHVRLQRAWERVLQPTLADEQGTFVMAGSPGEIMSGTFFDASCPGALTVTTAGSHRQVLSRPYTLRDTPSWALFQSVFDRDPELPQSCDEFTWSLHEWTKRDNTYLPHLWREALRRKHSQRWSDDHPIFLREDLGIWAAGESSLAYRFDASRNLWVPARRDAAWESLPSGHVWSYVIGCDLGVRDPFAIEIVAFSDSHPDMFHVYEFEQDKLTLPAMLHKLSSVYNEFSTRGNGVDALVGDFDALGDAVLEQMMDEYGLPIERAEKRDKRDHIELLNGDLVDGRCKLLPDTNLVRQMATIQWDDKNPLKEKPQPHNDCADAFVYLWRRTRHHFHRQLAPPAALPGTPPHHAAKLVERNRDLDNAVDSEDTWQGL